MTKKTPMQALPTQQPQSNATQEGTPPAEEGVETPPSAPTPPPASGDSLTIPVDPPAQEDPPQDTPTFSSADIERARQEEKEKLYGRLSKQEEQIQALVAEQEARQQAEAEAQRQAEAEAQAQEEEEMDVRSLLQKKEQEWEDRFADLHAQAEAERAVFERERELQAIDQYRQARLQEEQDEIMPELRDLVGGNTQEEIEQSIALVKDKTARILQEVTAQQQPVAPQAPRGASVTSPPVGPMENQTNHQTLTAEDMRNMSMDEYRQNREKILGALQERTRNRGIYG